MIECHECDLEYSQREGNPDMVFDKKGDWVSTSVYCPRCSLHRVNSIAVVSRVGKRIG